MPTQAERVARKAQERLDKALEAAKDSYRAEWERRDTPEHAALESRRQMLALQKVEQYLTRQIQERTK